jgi:hypothetical protein
MMLQVARKRKTMLDVMSLLVSVAEALEPPQMTQVTMASSSP